MELARSLTASKRTFHSTDLSIEPFTENVKGFFNQKSLTLVN